MSWWCQSNHYMEGLTTLEIGRRVGVVTVGSIVALFAFSSLLRSTGGYGAMLMVCPACCVIGPGLLLTLGRYPVLRATSLSK